MSRQATAIWQRLDQAQLVHGEMPLSDPAYRPWYAIVLLGIGGWLAAFQVLGIIGLTLQVAADNGVVLVIAGAVLCGTAVALTRLWHNVFAEQFSLALSLAGQATLLFGLFPFFDGQDRLLGIAFAAVEVVLFFAIQGLPHRIWSAAVATIALLYGISGVQHGLVSLAIVLAVFATVWLAEFRFAGRKHWLQAAGYGLLVVVFGLIALGVVDTGVFRSVFDNKMAAGRLLFDSFSASLMLSATVVTIAVIVAFEQRIVHDKSGVVLLVLTAVVGVTTFWAPGVGAGFVILLIGLAHSNRVLIALGVLGLLAYLAHFYFATDLSLLYKAYALLLTGASLLLIRQGMSWGGLLLSEQAVANDD